MGQSEPTTGMAEPRDEGRGKWMVLAAALLGWMFDGFEQGLFPLVGRPALREFLADESEVARWYAVATAGFLIGAATGGVLFGWLGDRIGRVRAMTLSVITYAVFSGLCGFSTSPTQIAVLRFLSSVGMGGEWSLGVALVMEIWPDRSRSLMAGLIGAAANVGYVLVSLIGMSVSNWIGGIEAALRSLSLPDSMVTALVQNQAWRLIMFLGALPALLTFFIRLFVPESERWEHEQTRGAAAHWAARDLLGVGVGVAAAWGIIFLLMSRVDLYVQIGGTVFGLILITLGYCYPVVRYLQRSAGGESTGATVWLPTIRRMLLGACLGGVPLIVTWSSVQWSSVWTDQLTKGVDPIAKAETQFFAAGGAVLGCIGGAWLGGLIGRRITYTLLCACAFVSTYLFFRTNDAFNTRYIVCAFLVGVATASFYGWLPLYLPELFPTRLRAAGQGFSYNFGRNLAMVATLVTGNLTGLFHNDYSLACFTMSFVYLIGMGVVWLAPETRGQPLPE